MVEQERPLHNGYSVGVRRYEDLFAWQTAEGFKREVYRNVLNSGPAKSDLRYRSQIFEAARGVVSNITEGFLRYSPGDFRRFLDYALGSLGEAERRLHDGIQMGYFPAESCAEAFRLARRCAKACVRLKQSHAVHNPTATPDVPDAPDVT